MEFECHITVTEQFSVAAQIIAARHNWHYSHIEGEFEPGHYLSRTEADLEQLQYTRDTLLHALDVADPLSAGIRRVKIECVLQDHIY